MDPALAGAFSDPGWDRAIEASMVEAADLCGSTAASPTIALESAPGQAFFGPVLSHKPEGQAGFQFKAGMEFEYWLEAIDNCDVPPGPNGRGGPGEPRLMSPRTSGGRIASSSVTSHA